jgi:hypothetical protein
LIRTVHLGGRHDWARFSAVTLKTASGTKDASWIWVAAWAIPRTPKRRKDNCFKSNILKLEAGGVGEERNLDNESAKDDRTSYLSDSQRI